MQDGSTNFGYNQPLLSNDRVSDDRGAVKWGPTNLPLQLTDNVGNIEMPDGNPWDISLYQNAIIKLRGAAIYNLNMDAKEGFAGTIYISTDVDGIIINWPDVSKFPDGTPPVIEPGVMIAACVVIQGEFYWSFAQNFS